MDWLWPRPRPECDASRPWSRPCWPDAARWRSATSAATDSSRLVEIVSPANKDRPRHVEDLVDKVVSALERGVHVLLVDLFPPGPHDPCGLHGFIFQSLENSDELYDWPAEEPLTLASYVAGPSVDIYLEHLAVGALLAEMPLFLRPDRYVNVPLESTYQASYRGMPAFWREILEGRSMQTE